MLSSIVTDGIDDLLIQYFKLRFNVTVDDIVRRCCICWRCCLIFTLSDGLHDALQRFAAPHLQGLMSRCPLTCCELNHVHTKRDAPFKIQVHRYHASVSAADSCICGVRRVRGAGADPRPALPAEGAVIPPPIFPHSCLRRSELG